MAVLLGYALTAARVISVQPLILSGALAVLVGSCALLVPRHGGLGAAWSMVVASGVHASGSWFALRWWALKGVAPRSVAGGDVERAPPREAQGPPPTYGAVSPSMAGPLPERSGRSPA
jgi:hypothetical protein